MLRRPASPAPAPIAWPSAEPVDGALRIEGRLVGGFELAPVNLELMAEGEREAALESLAALYDAVPRPFSLLSVPADRPPHEHLGAIEERLPSRRAREWYRPYAALYRELSAAPRRPLRRAYLLLDAPSGPELERALGVVGRMAEEQGLAARQVPGDDLVALWADLARLGATYRLSAGLATAEDVLAAAALGRRWPAEIAPGWLAPLLAVPGVAATAMRVRPLSRPEAMAFLTTRLRQVRAAERLATERGELADVERERLGATAVAGRRRVHAGEGRVYLVDTVFLVEAPDRASLRERLELLRLEATGRRHRSRARHLPPGRRLVGGPARSRATPDRRAQPRLGLAGRLAPPRRLATCTSRRATCTGSPGGPRRRSSSIASATPATTRSCWARPAPARRCSPAPRWAAASCAASGSWRSIRWATTAA